MTTNIKARIQSKTITVNQPRLNPKVKKNINIDKYKYQIRIYMYCFVHCDCVGITQISDSATRQRNLREHYCSKYAFFSSAEIVSHSPVTAVIPFQEPNKTILVLYFN